MIKHFVKDLKTHLLKNKKQNEEEKTILKYTNY